MIFKLNLDIQTNFNSHCKSIMVKKLGEDNANFEEEEELRKP